jgi:hypothetical protein
MHRRPSLFVTMCHLCSEVLFPLATGQCPVCSKRLLPLDPRKLGKVPPEMQVCLLKRELHSQHRVASHMPVLQWGQIRY